MTLSYDEQLEVNTKVLEILGEDLGFTIPSPYAEVTAKLIAKIDELNATLTDLTAQVASLQSAPVPSPAPAPTGGN